MPKILCKHKNTNNVNDTLKRDKTGYLATVY